MKIIWKIINIDQYNITVEYENLDDGIKIVKTITRKTNLNEVKQMIEKNIPTEEFELWSLRGETKLEDDKQLKLLLEG